MLEAFKSRTHDQDHLTVYYPYEPRAVIATHARFLEALNPYGAIPPSEDPMLVIADMEPSEKAIREMNLQMSRLGTSILDEARVRATAVKTAAGSSLQDVAGWLTLASLTTPQQDFLFHPALPAVPAGSSATVSTDQLAAGEALRLLAAKAAGGWLDKEDIKALKLITLYGRYGQLIAASSFLTTETKPQEGVPKELHAIMTRVTKLQTLAYVLHDSIAIAPLREKAALLTSPALLPFLEFVLPDTKDRILSYATQLLALKMHPWIADAERGRLMARRYTRWAPSSQTMGLTAGTFGTWDLLKRYSVARDGTKAEAIDMRNILMAEDQPDSLLTIFLKEARDLIQRRAVMNQPLIQQCETVLALTSPSNPPQVHLHGDQWRVIVQTGDAASEALSDIHTVLNRPRTPFTEANLTTFIAGPTALMEYNATYWVTGVNGQAGGPYNQLRHDFTMKDPYGDEVRGEPPFYVQQQRPDLAEAFGLRQLAPSMIQPVTSEFYAGDDDAVLGEYSLAGVASMLSYTNVASMLSATKTMKALERLFKWDSTTKAYTNVYAADYLFHSSRTRQPWRRPVYIPRTAMPTVVMAMDDRTPPQTMDIAALVARTEDKITPGSSTTAFADGAAINAAKMLGIM